MSQEELKEEIAHLCCKGTTTKPDQLRVLWVSESGKTALVKHPGGMDGYGFGGSWVPGWVDRVDVGALRERGSFYGDGVRVEVMGEVTRSNRVTKARLAKMVEEAEKAEAERAQAR